MKLSSALLGLSSFATARQLPNNWRNMWVADTWLAKTFMKELNDLGEVLNFEERILTGFPAEVATVDHSFFEPAWYFVNENGDDVIIPDEFGSCEKRLTHLMDSFGFSNGDEIVHYYYRIVDGILEFTDVDKSWSLSFDEWRDTQAIVAASFSLVILEAFDADENGLIDSAELRTWPSTLQEMVAGYDWQPNASQLAAISAAWAQSQTDEDPSSASKIELARFTILMYNSFLEFDLTRA